METGKTTPDIIVISVGLAGASAKDLVIIRAIQETNPQVIVLSPEELTKRRIEELNKIAEIEKPSPFENPIPYVITERFEGFTPPKTRQQRRAEERKNNKRK